MADPVKFTFKGKHNDDDATFFDVRVIKNDEDKYGSSIGTLYHGGEGTKKRYWKWNETRPSDLASVVNDIHFPTKEDAANFLYLLHTRSEQYKTENPLPEDVKRYLTSRAEYLRKTEERVLGEFLEIRSERWQLLQFAKRNQIDEVEWRTEDSDQTAMVRKLLDFEVYVKKEKKEVPLFSETALYNLIGKEDARTVLSLLRDVVKCIAPNITYEI